MQQSPPDNMNAAAPFSGLIHDGWKLINVYPYTNENGDLLYENCRFEQCANGDWSKTFRQRRPNGSGFVCNLDGVRRVPYRLPELIERHGHDAHLAEGEKDADTLAALGLCSTSIASANNVELEAFRDRNVFIHEDNDADGRGKAVERAAALSEVAASVCIVRYRDAGDGGDVSDWLAQGRGLEDLLVRCDEAEAFHLAHQEQAECCERTSNRSRPALNRGAPSKRETAFAQTALDNICAELRAMPRDSGRNDALNRGAHRLGRMAARGWIDEQAVFHELREACRTNGLMADDPRAVERTIESGWQAGLRDPHPDLEDRPYNRSADHGARAKWSGEVKAQVNRHDEVRVKVRETEADDDELPIKQWPVLGSTAMRGLVGEFVKLATRESEADPVAVLTTSLVWGAATFGRRRYYMVGDGMHHARLNAVLVGKTGKARKGTSMQPVRTIYRAAEKIIRTKSTLPFPLGLPLTVTDGLSSGEGLVAAICDESDDGKNPGVKDKRLLVIESEFGGVLRQYERQGNTLSQKIRCLWDGEDVHVVTRANPLKTTEPHVCILGHITRQELLKLLPETEIWNGSVNRYLWVPVRRGQLLANPSPMPEDDVAYFAKEFADVIEYAHLAEDDHRRFIMTNSAAALFADLYYGELSVEHSGILGAITSRCDASVLRLALTYAHFDCAQCIERDHVEAAITAWRYCFDGARYLFTDEVNVHAKRIIAALKKGDMKQTEIVQLFSGHISKNELSVVLSDLQEDGVISSGKRQTGGRPATVWSLLRTKDLSEERG